MIRRLSHIFIKSKKNAGAHAVNLGLNSGHMLKIHRHLKGADSNVDMTENEVRRTLKRQDLIQNHMEKKVALRDIKVKVSRLDGILQKLNEMYTMADVDCCFCNFCKELDMQDMIVAAIHLYELALAYEDTDNEKSDQEEGDTFVSPINRLVKDSKRLSIINHWQLSKERHYAKMSTEEIVKKLVMQEDGLTKLNMQYKQMEMRLTKMSEDYQLAREVSVWKRFRLLKDIIQEATMDCIPLR